MIEGGRIIDLAHGIGGRSDLPLSLSLVAYSAGAVLVLSFAALAWLWPRPRWEAGIAGRRITSGVLAPIAIVLRVASFGLLAVVLWSAFTGPDDPQANIASSYLYVIWWVGLMFAAGVLGDVWRVLGPTSLLTSLAPKERHPYTWGHWPAAVGIGAFTWLELVHPNASSPRIVGIALLIYLASCVAGLAVFGRVWAEQGDPFGALFGLIGRMGIASSDDGALRLRPPLVGLSTLPRRPGTVALVIITLGSTTFDGLARTRIWTNLVGDGGVLISTAGLVWTIGVVYALYRLACTAMPILAGAAPEDRDPDAVADTFIHSLVPIALAYAVAHYFSLLVFEGQTFLRLLLGQSSWTISYTALSPSAIAFVQVGAIVVGHVAAVILAHDRAVSRYALKVATRTQYPMLAVMVGYTVAALVILLGG